MDLAVGDERRLKEAGTEGKSTNRRALVVYHPVERLEIVESRSVVSYRRIVATGNATAGNAATDGIGGEGDEGTEG